MATVSSLLLAGSVTGFFLADCLPDIPGNAEVSPLYRQTLDHGKLIALLFFVLSLGSLVAGVFIARFKNWSRVLGQVTALVYLAYIWHQTSLVAGGTGNGIARGLLGSIPLLLLIRFLSKKQVKSRFRLNEAARPNC